MESLFQIKPLEFKRGNKTLTLSGATFADCIFGRVWVHYSLASGGQFCVSFHGRNLQSGYFQTEDEAIEWAKVEYQKLLIKESLVERDDVTDWIAGADHHAGCNAAYGFKYQCKCGLRTIRNEGPLPCDSQP